MSALDQRPLVALPRAAQREAATALRASPTCDSTPIREAAVRIAKGGSISALWLTRQFARPGLTSLQRALLGGATAKRRAYEALARYRDGRPMDARWRPADD